MQAGFEPALPDQNRASSPLNHSIVATFVVEHGVGSAARARGVSASPNETAKI